MRRGLLCLLTLAAALPAAVRARPGPPPPPAPPPLLEPAPWNPAAAISDGTATCGDCRTATARFIVMYERHFGFSLRHEGDLDTIVWLVFANDPARAPFDRFFASSDMAALVGKRIYCDCAGVSYDMEDVRIFRVSGARLFAR